MITLCHLPLSYFSSLFRHLTYLWSLVLSCSLNFSSSIFWVAHILYIFLSLTLSCSFFPSLNLFLSLSLSFFFPPRFCTLFIFILRIALPHFQFCNSPFNVLFTLFFTLSCSHTLFRAFFLSLLFFISSSCLLLLLRSLFLSIFLSFMLDSNI